MNHFYLAKKFCFLSAVLNMTGSILLIILISIVSYYHFSVLISKTNNYKDLLQKNDNGGDSFTNSTIYASSYINSYGYEKFFGVTLVGNMTYWPIVCGLFVITTFCFVVKTVLCIFNIISSFKAKSIAYVHASLLDLFFPLIGGFLSLMVCKDNKKIIEYKAVLPLQWFRYKMKNIFYQILSDVNMKNL